MRGGSEGGGEPEPKVFRCCELVFGVWEEGRQVWGLMVDAPHSEICYQLKADDLVWRILATGYSLHISCSIDIQVCSCGSDNVCGGGK